MLKEAMLYRKLEDSQTHCAVCSHRCRIAEGKRGICGVRENRQGVLYALNYSKTVAANVDPIEKKPLYHFLPGSKIYSFAAVGCNLRCSWCQNWQISQSPASDQPILGEEIAPQEHVNRALRYHCPSLAYTYSEPTIYLEYALETMKLAKEQGLKNVWVSNGFMTEETLKEVLPYLDAANVDFKGPDDEVYTRYCGARAEPVMENLRLLWAAGVHLEITTLIVPGVNDAPEQLDRIARFISEELSTDVPWHISRFFPAWKMLETAITPRASLDLAAAIGQKAGLRHIHLGNV